MALATTLLLVVNATYAEEGPPVCIKTASDGSLVAVPGPCPDQLGGTVRDEARSSAERGSPSSAYSTSSPPTSSIRSSTTGTSAPRPLQVQNEITRIALVSREDEALQQFEVLVSHGIQIQDPLIRIFHNRNADPRERWVAGRALGRISSEASAAALMKGLKDKDPMVRIAAARGLQEQRNPRARAALRGALNDKGAVVRAAMVDALGYVGTQSDAAIIAEQLTAPANFHKGQSLFVRPHAATTLGRLGGDVAIQALISVADDTDPDTRAAARDALLRLSGRTTVPRGGGSVQQRWAAYFGQTHTD